MKASESMTNTAFEKLSATKTKSFLKRLNKVWNGSPFDTEKTMVHARNLSFFPGWLLAEASDATILPEKKCVFLDNGDQCVPLTFDANFITNFSASNDVDINSDTANDYVRFWTEHVRPGSERFHLIETVDDMPWREEPTPQARKSLSSEIKPLTMISSDSKGMVFTACLLFRDALMDCKLQLAKNGEITIIDRDIMAQDLTVIDPTTGF